MALTVVQTQQLAQVSDLDVGPPTSAMIQALAMFTTEQKNVYLRRASGVVLAAYAKRMTLPLQRVGDFTVFLVVSVARNMMLTDRGYNATNPADKAIRDRYDDAQKILDEIVDLENKTPRMDPDVIDSTESVDEEGALSLSEGGDLDQADEWTQTYPTRPGMLRGLSGGGSL